MKLSTSAKVSIVSNAVALLALGLSWHGWPSAAPLSYAVHKALHVAGVVVFAGNLVAGPLWLVLAWSEEGRPHLRFAVRALVAADIWLTAPGLQLALWNGLALAAAMGGARHHAWLREAFVWLVITSVVGLVAVLPAQERLATAVEQGDEAATRRAMIQWSVWGSLVGVPMTAVAWLMIAKQPLLAGAP